MMTMDHRPETGTGQGPEENAPRCDFGSKSQHPCWREATQRKFAEDPAPMVCEEHFLAIQTGREVDSYLTALYKLREWITSEVDGEYENRLTNHAYWMRDALESEYWQAVIKDRAAEIIANAGPGEHISPEDAEEFAEVSLRDDALSDARAILEDAPEELFGSKNRWEIVAGLVVATRDVNQEHEEIKRRIGLK